CGHLLFNDDSAGDRQFKLKAYLQAGFPYILVVTTHNQDITGPFSITAAGSAYVDFVSTNITEATMIAPNLTGTTTSLNSERYPGSSKYYQAIEIIVNITDTYTLTSSSTMDTIGYPYNSTFYPSDSNVNLLTSNDDYDGSNQFKLIVYLNTSFTYTLVVTTYNPDTTETFSIFAAGPNSLYFLARNNK
ncbi:unnamed protein product, partial [Rotaria sp. Silwood2]